MYAEGPIRDSAWRRKGRIYLSLEGHQLMWGGDGCQRMESKGGFQVTDGIREERERREIKELRKAVKEKKERERKKERIKRELKARNIQC